MSPVGNQRANKILKNKIRLSSSYNDNQLIFLPYNNDTEETEDIIIVPSPDFCRGKYNKPIPKPSIIYNYIYWWIT